MVVPTPLQGTLVTWKADKGFGFIRPQGGGQDVFVHLRDFGIIGRSPRVGDVIRFQRVSDGAGRFRAADVSIAGLERQSGRVPKARRRPEVAANPASSHTPPGMNRGLRVGPWRWLAVAGFAGLLVVLATRTALPWIVVPVYVVASLVTFMLYAFDKAAAMNGRWRTSEATLLLAGLVGGWPGALLAQGMFRHKSSKLEFLVPFCISVAANCAMLYWACRQSGASAIRGLVY